MYNRISLTLQAFISWKFKSEIIIFFKFLKNNIWFFSRRKEIFTTSKGFDYAITPFPYIHFSHVIRIL